MKFLQNEEVAKVFKFRHACKEFNPTKSVSEADLRTILEAGRLSPSSFGFEPWRFLVLQSEQVRQKIFDSTWGGQDALENASAFVVILARTNKGLHPQSEYLRHIMRDVKGLSQAAQKARLARFTSFVKEYFCIFEDEGKVFDWACKQCYIALGNMLTTAALLGIDSLAIEGFERKSVSEILQNEGLLDGEEFGVAVMAAFGYKKHEPKHPQTRQDFAEVVKFV